jgi:hypothetical protein
MLCRVSFLHRENQLTKAPRLPIVMFRAAHAALFTFARQRGCGNFKSCAPNSRPIQRVLENEFVVVTGTRTARDFIRLLTVELH